MNASESRAPNASGSMGRQTTASNVARKLGRALDAGRLDEVSALSRQVAQDAPSLAPLVQAATLVRSASRCSDMARWTEAQALLNQASGALLTVETDADAQVLRKHLAVLIEDAELLLRINPLRKRRLRVGAGADWFELEGRGRVRLDRRPRLRAVLNALVDAPRHRSPRLDTWNLLEVAWGSARRDGCGMENRVHAAISRLRKLGLGRVLCRDETGYYLSESAHLVVAGDDPRVQG